MRKVFLFFVLFFTLVYSSFAFDITDSDNNLREYFSNNHHQVFVKTDLNLSNFSIDYISDSVNKSEIFNLTTCQINFCSNFSLLNFVNSTIFDIKLGNLSKTIYLDNELPQFNFLNYSFDKVNKLLLFNFSSVDNYGISKIELYKKENSNLIFIENITNKTINNLSVNKTGNLVLDFKVFDKAGNFINYEKTIYVEDIFEPQILDYFLILENNNYKFKFSVLDEILKKYELVQNTVTLSEIISGTSYKKEIPIPFNSGIVLFNVEDNNSNLNNVTLNLASPFNNLFDSKFSNQKTFKFTSNAQSCLLIDLDSVLMNQNFTKSSNVFSIDLNVNLIKDYLLKISCVNSNFEEIFNKYFFYDTEKPSEINFTIDKLDDGSLKILWDESKDNQSSVRYKLFRNNEVIYSGNKLNFLDKAAVYPNTYNYYLEVFDEAGNYVQTLKQDVIPKKVLVTFTTTNLVSGKIVEDKVFNFKLFTDINSTIIITQKLENNIISIQNLNNNESNEVNVNLELIEGNNIITVKVIDNFGNIKEEIYSLIYSPPILITNNANLVPIPKPVITAENSIQPIVENVTSTNNVITETNNYFWLWILFWIIILAFFLWFFIINESSLREKLSNISRSKSSNNNFHHKRKFDSKLDKSLEKIKMNRAIKQEKIKKELKLNDEKSKRILSDFERKKHSDLSNLRPKSDILFSINERQKTKKRTDNIKNESLYQIESKPKQINHFQNFSKLFSKNRKNETDDFSDYIMRKRSEKSWSNTKEYLMKTQVEKMQNEIEKIRKISEERDLQLKERQLKEEEIRKKQEDKERRILEKIKLNEDKQSAKKSLDDYLFKKTKKRSWFFAESDVNRDLKSRNK